MNITQMLLKKYPDNKHSEFNKIEKKLREFDNSDEARKQDEEMKEAYERKEK